MDEIMHAEERMSIISKTLYRMVRSRCTSIIYGYYPLSGIQGILEYDRNDDEYFIQDGEDVVTFKKGDVDYIENYSLYGEPYEIYLIDKERE